LADGIEEIENTVSLVLLVAIFGIIIWGVIKLKDLFGDKQSDSSKGTVMQNVHGVVESVKNASDYVFGSEEDQAWHDEVNKDDQGIYTGADGVPRHADGTPIALADRFPSAQVLKSYTDGTILPANMDPNDVIGNSVFDWIKNNRVF